MFLEPARVARIIAGARAAVFTYRFGYVPEYLRAKMPGAFHASELPFSSAPSTPGTAPRHRRSRGGAAASKLSGQFRKDRRALGNGRRALVARRRGCRAPS